MHHNVYRVQNPLSHDNEKQNWSGSWLKKKEKRVDLSSFTFLLLAIGNKIVRTMKGFSDSEMEGLLSAFLMISDLFRQRSEQFRKQNAEFFLKQFVEFTCTANNLTCGLKTFSGLLSSQNFDSH